jgi:rhodanese-related sulfurtransferase
MAQQIEFALWLALEPTIGVWLRQQGFEKAHSVSGGINAWFLRIDPTIPRY